MLSTSVKTRSTCLVFASRKRGHGTPNERIESYSSSRQKPHHRSDFERIATSENILSIRNIAAHSLEINSEIREAVHQANANYCSQMQKLTHLESLEREKEQRKLEEAARKAKERACEINERKRVEKQKEEKRKLAMDYLEHAKN